MILKKMIGAMGAHYGFAFEYLYSKYDGTTKLRVLDIGAASNPWGGSWITHIVDNFFAPDTEQQFIDRKLNIFKVDVEDYINWDPVLADVEKNGKFDFVICSHTLEDLNNPKIALQMINKIGKAGYISMPSKYAEFTKFEVRGGLTGYNGYHHHRWIYQIKDDVLIGYPKMNFLEYAKLEEGEVNTIVEIAFIWEDGFDYELVAPHELLDNIGSENRLSQLLQKGDLFLGGPNIIETDKKVNLYNLIDKLEKDILGSVIYPPEPFPEGCGRYTFYSNCMNYIKEKTGLFLEFGVFQGATINLFSSLLPNKLFYGFDSFDGLPEEWLDICEKGRFATEVPKVNNNVSLVKGLFQDTLEQFLQTNPARISFAHIDCDIYSSAKCIFDQIKDRVEDDCLIIFDDFLKFPHYKDHSILAFAEFLIDTGYEYIPFGIVENEEFCRAAFVIKTK